MRESEGRLHVWMMRAFHVRVVKVFVCLVFLEGDGSESVRQDRRLINLVAAVPTIELSEIIILTAPLDGISYVHGGAIYVNKGTGRAPRIATAASSWVCRLIEQSLEVMIVR